MQVPSHVVGIGASAGGLSVTKENLQAGARVVVIEDGLRGRAARPRDARRRRHVPRRADRLSGDGKLGLLARVIQIAKNTNKDQP